MIIPAIRRGQRSLREPYLPAARSWQHYLGSPPLLPRVDRGEQSHAWALTFRRKTPPRRRQSSLHLGARAFSNSKRDIHAALFCAWARKERDFESVQESETTERRRQRRQSPSRDKARPAHRGPGARRELRPGRR